MDKQKEFEKGFEEWKEKQIEEMSMIMNKTRMENVTVNPYTKQICYPLSPYAGAKALAKAGYGNVKEALTEFAESLKNNMNVNVYNNDFVNKVIDETLKEFLKDER